MSWDLWVDYHPTDEQGLTHTNVGNSSVELREGDFVVVGNEEADPAVAEIATVEPDGTVLVRVLPGPADQHLQLVAGRRAASEIEGI